jgi:4-hydroxybenzoate polyprenyltransferase
MHLLRRLYIYQKERFPLAVHGLLIAAFSFSAIAYSRLCRGETHFIPLPDYLACFFTNLTLFFLLRVADEYKDHADDTAMRPYLPVARGLVSLKELRNTGALLFGLALLLNIAAFPALLPFFAATMGYLALMRYEFFAGGWLKRHMGVYMFSHMFIIPLADMYASAYDWRLSGVAPPGGLLWFFAVSYLNGIVLEMGRKIRVPEAEEPGVQTYTRIWGPRKGPAIWLVMLALNFCVAWIAARHARHPGYVFISLAVLVSLALLPGILFLIRPRQLLSKWIEGISLIWALGMYLLLGGIPQAASIFSATP